MPISNYTTKIASNKTLGEIQEILGSHGADKIMINYDNKQPVAISFMYTINGTEVGFQLPANYKGVLGAMTKDKKVPRTMCTADQALRVSWRILRDWIEAQMAMVEAEQSDVLQVFLPYAILPSGKTFYDQAIDTNVLLLK